MLVKRWPERKKNAGEEVEFLISMREELGLGFSVGGEFLNIYIIEFYC